MIEPTVISPRRKGAAPIPEAGTQSPGYDPMARWRSAPAQVFEHVWTTATAPSTPVGVRATLLQALWEIRTLWKPSGAMPRAIDGLRAAVLAHVEAAQWAIKLPGDAATRGLTVTQHWKTAVRLALEVGQAAWLGSNVDALRSAQRQLVDDAPHWAFGLIEVELDLAAPRRLRAADVVSDQRLECSHRA